MPRTMHLTMHTKQVLVMLTYSEAESSIIATLPSLEHGDPAAAAVADQVRVLILEELSPYAYLID